MADLILHGRDVNILESRQPEMLAEMIPFISLALIAVVMRFSIRKYFRIPYGADDYMIVLGFVCFLKSCLIFDFSAETV